MIKIGLTGGIGSGKSTVTKMLSDKGFIVIDADTISKDVLKKYPEILEKIKIEFGSGFFDWRGEFRRREFGNHIFRFPKQRKKYEDIIIPYIKDEIFKEIEKYEKLLVNECGALVKIREEYILIRNEISNLRREYSNNLLKDTNIRLKVKRFRNTEHFEYKFREIIQKKQSFDDDINNIINECYIGNIVNNIDELADKFKNINSSKENDSAYSAKFNNVIKGLNNEQIAEISMFIPEDYIEIEYKPSGSNEYKSLKNASAGQRTSAILTFILSDGDKPLILDQPEDDLDNHLIYDLVVERLRICKEKRQIIVVTHNANIPVNGDAELIVAMDSNSRYVKVYKSGGVEEDELRAEICNVMEGGEKAFLMRANRYRIEK